MQVTLDALGTKWWITLPNGAKDTLIKELKSTITEFEDKYSRFKSTSLIGKLNDFKILKNPPAELINMLNYALDVYEATEGVFNISIGSKLEKTGYGIKVDKSSKVSSSLLDDVIISEEKILLSKNTRIDLGGFGKGWLIEKLAGLLKHRGIEKFIINGGGDITVYGEPETIYIGHPTDEAMHVGGITINNQSLASSSNLKRTWEFKGKKHAHIVHPKNDSKVDVLSIHVLAENILFADTFATVFLLVPRSKRLELAHRYQLNFMEILPDLTTFKTGRFNINLNE